MALSGRADIDGVDSIHIRPLLPKRGKLTMAKSKMRQLVGVCFNLLRRVSRNLGGTVRKGAQYLRDHWHPVLEVVIGSLLVIVTFLSVNLQGRFQDLEERDYRRNVQPMIEGEFVRAVKPDDTTAAIRVYWKCSNVGGDTAFGVWYCGRGVLLADSFIAFAQYSDEQFAMILASPDGRFGSFSEGADRKLRPGESWWIAGRVAAGSLYELARLLNATAMYEIQLVYWDNTPLKRHSHIEYYLLGKHGRPSEYHTKISSVLEMSHWLRKIDTLLSTNSIAFYTRLPAWYVFPWLEPLETPDTSFSALLMNQRSWIEADKMQSWDWGDTLVSFENRLWDIGELREFVWRKQNGR